jgi:hypothetical protein
MHTSRTLCLLAFSVLVFRPEVDMDIYNSLDSPRNEDNSDLKPDLYPGSVS